MTHTLLVIAVVAGLVELTAHPRATMHPDPAVASDERPGGGIIVRDICTEVWLPDEWVAIAAMASEHGVMESHQALMKYLESVGKQNLWYLIVFEGHQANGEMQTRKMVRQPYTQPEHFEEFREILATASGRPDPSRLLDLTTDSILGIPNELRGLSPGEAYAKLASGWQGSTISRNAEPAPGAGLGK